MELTLYSSIGSKLLAPSPKSDKWIFIILLSNCIVDSSIVLWAYLIVILLPFFMILDWAFEKHNLRNLLLGPVDYEIVDSTLLIYLHMHLILLIFIIQTIIAWILEFCWFLHAFDCSSGSKFLTCRGLNILTKNWSSYENLILLLDLLSCVHLFQLYLLVWIVLLVAQ